MRFLELARTRVSVRGYADRPVDEAALEQVLEAGGLAPSACNLQPWHIIVVRDPVQRRALSAAYARSWFSEAPVILALCVEPTAAWKRSDGKNYVDVDGALAMDHMTLCAADLGLGTCWIGAFDPHVARQVLGLPPGIELLALTPLGHPTDPGRPKQRKDPAAIVRHEHW